MTDVILTRVTGRIEGDFVVFLIGMRINKPGSCTNGFRRRARCRRC
jgi:hypothetical protein